MLLRSLVAIALSLAVGWIPPGPSTDLEVEFIGNMAFRISDGTTTLLTDFPYRSGAFGYMAYEAGDPSRFAGATEGARVDARRVVVYHHLDDEEVASPQPFDLPRQGERFLVAGAPRASTAQARAERTPLLLVSMDGFRWDYLDLYPTPNLDRVVGAGVRADGLIPVFPSKTFPSHYSIVTGLYPGHHGIISNNMRDPRWDETFSLGARAEVENERWWGGEPIWVTAARNGIRSAVYFWPGSEAPVGGARPDEWRRFDGSVPFAARVDQVLEWLSAPAPARPGVVALYFGEPNNAGHAFGPLANETRDAVGRVDRAVGRLLDGLESLGGSAAFNLVFVSDHGMAQNDEARVIVLDDYVDLLPGELFEQGALVQIFPRPGREEEILAALRGAHPNLHVYPRDALPERFHLFDHPRLPPILATPDPGWEAVGRFVVERADWAIVAGDHGQDPSHLDMHGLFVAAGPDFSVGARVGRIEAVDVYQLLAGALGVEPAAHDGSVERVAGVLRSRPIAARPRAR